MAAGGATRPAAVPMATLFRCPLCRRTAFSGRRSHLHSAGHQRRLRDVLARLREKVAAAREALRAGAQVGPSQQEEEERFWCPCCRREARRHLRQGGLAALHGGLLEHLASPEHKKAVCKFWWENKADPSLKCQFLIPSEEYELFKVSLTKALDAYEASKDEVIQQMAAHIRQVEQSRQELVQATLECKFFALIDKHRTAQLTTDGDRAVQGSCQDLSNDPKETQGEGNVHTGAKPPWLLEEEKNTGQIGPSYEEFLKEREKQKLKKLPPERVGANFDHTSQTGEGWLPSFGRVWNHGRRWQSRHQFKAETGQKKLKRKKRQVPGC